MATKTKTTKTKRTAPKAKAKPAAELPAMPAELLATPEEAAAWTIHPMADLFRKLAEPARLRLRADLDEHGQRDAVWLWGPRKGAALQLIDGRHRTGELVALGKPVRYRVHDGDLASARALVLSLNVARRHLTVEEELGAYLELGLVDELLDEAEARKLEGALKGGELAGLGVRKSGKRERRATTVELLRDMIPGATKGKAAAAIRAAKARRDGDATPFPELLAAELDRAKAEADKERQRKADKLAAKIQAEAEALAAKELAEAEAAAPAKSGWLVPVAAESLEKPGANGGAKPKKATKSKAAKRPAEQPSNAAGLPEVDPMEARAEVSRDELRAMTPAELVDHAHAVQMDLLEMMANYDNAEAVAQHAQQQARELAAEVTQLRAELAKAGGAPQLPTDDDKPSQVDGIEVYLDKATKLTKPASPSQLAAHLGLSPKSATMRAVMLAAYYSPAYGCHEPKRGTWLISRR